MPRGRKREEWRQRPRIENNNSLHFQKVIEVIKTDVQFQKLEPRVQKGLYSYLGQIPVIIGDLLSQSATQENITEARKAFLTFALKNNVHKILARSEQIQIARNKKGMGLRTEIVIGLHRELVSLQSKVFESVTSDPTQNLETFLTNNQNALLTLVCVWN